MKLNCRRACTVEKELYDVFIKFIDDLDIIFENEEDLQFYHREYYKL